MRKITVLAMISLDGVIQSPGSSEEDPENDFKLGGWVAPYWDEIGDKATTEELTQTTDFMLGRKTFEIWENYWPKHYDRWAGISEGTKYIFSDTRDNSDWKNSAFIKTLAELKSLKATDGPDFHIWGSSELVHLLLENNLIDELRLKIYPIILGKGKKLFPEGALPAAFKLKSSSVTGTGVILANYEREGEVKTRDIEEQM